MASRDIEILSPGFRDKVSLVLGDLRTHYIDYLVYNTYRSPAEQARLFRQGRSYLREILPKIIQLRNTGFVWIPELIEKVGPQYGRRRVTGAAPGEGWHEWLKALDGVPMRNGKPVWKYNRKTKYIFNTIGMVVRQHDLTWGGDFKKRDAFHIQFRPEGNALKAMISQGYDPLEIEGLLIKLMERLGEGEIL